MGSKSNQILIGVIILLIGVFMLLKPVMGIGFGVVMSLAVGSAFLLLYFTKRKSWSLVAGSYLLYLGFVWVIQPFVSKNLYNGIISAMFFIVPAAIFFVLYYDKTKRALLVPGCIFFWFGLFMLAGSLGITDANWVPVFSFSMAMAFITMYALGRGYIGKWAVYIASGFIAAAVLSLINVSGLSLGAPAIGAGLLIALAVVIIIRAVRK